MLKVAILISGRGSNMQSLVNASKEKDFPAKIVCVISNKASAKGLDWAKEQGIPTCVINHKDFKSRDDFDDALTKEIEKYDAKFICLAGFMRILGAKFVEHWKDRSVNIHPSLLPSFPGLDVQQAAIDYGAKFSGCTIHFLRAEMDHGPIIIQAVVPVLIDDNEEALSKRILEQEHKIYPKALLWIAQGRVNVHNEKCFIADIKTPPAITNPC